MYSEAQLLPWLNALQEALPGLTTVDAHLHVGLHDPAGFQATPEEVLECLRVAAARGVVFPLKEPAGYRVANEQAAALAQMHPDLLSAFGRLDPRDDPLAEADRCLDAGAVGLKLHPRGEDFEIADTRLDDVFELADERRLPLMIHAGAGDPSVVEHVLARARAHPNARLILAHCAVASFAAAVEAMSTHSNVYIDTAWWNPSDVLALIASVPAERVLFASDVPFAGPVLCQVLTGRIALQTGLSAERTKLLMGEQTGRLLEHGEPVPMAAPPGPGEPLAPELERLYVTLCTVVEPMLRGDPPGQGLELARGTCERPGEEHAEVMQSVGRLLDLAAKAEERDPLRPLRTPGFDLVLAAAVVARTPDVVLPAPRGCWRGRGR
jgi:Tat protein secretion system quality control protein TatD with DNase activity